jgi:hypothetical protein
MYELVHEFTAEELVKWANEHGFHHGWCTARCPHFKTRSDACPVCIIKYGPIYPVAPDVFFDIMVAGLSEDSRYASWIIMTDYNIKQLVKAEMLVIGEPGPESVLHSIIRGIVANEVTEWARSRRTNLETIRLKQK